MPNFTEAQIRARESARAFNENEAPRFIEGMDRDNTLPPDLVPALARYGLLGLKCPEKYGGRGLDMMGAVLAVEELARISPAIADLVLSVNASTGVLSLFGSDDLSARYLPPVIRGEKIPAYALTEPHAGSDLAGIKTRAEKTGTGYLLSGCKKLITLAGAADFVIVLAVTDPSAEKPTRGMSLLVTEEFRTGRPIRTMGLRGLSLGWMTFQECRVPSGNLLGRENEGFRQIMKSLDGGRIETAALSVGLAQGALDMAVAYAKIRTQFGKPIAQHQGIRFLIAEMRTRIDAARALTREAARLKDAGETHSLQASEAKLFASEIALQCASDSLQIHGGNGYTQDYAIERFFRDAKVIQLFEGTSQIQKIIIARHLLDAPEA